MEKGVELKITFDFIEGKEPIVIKLVDKFKILFDIDPINCVNGYNSKINWVDFLLEEDLKYLYQYLVSNDWGEKKKPLTLSRYFSYYYGWHTYLSIYCVEINKNKCIKTFCVTINH